MNRRFTLTALAFALLTACGGSNRDAEVIAQRYVHKYGYDVSPEDWSSHDYPGQIITTLKNGVTVAEGFEEGRLHGPRTVTYPHSQTLNTLEVYSKGSLTRRVTYSVRGVPSTEENFCSPTETKVTTWYHSGSPRSQEEFVGSVLMSAEYYNQQNEVESRIEEGSGQKTIRNSYGDLLAKEVIRNTKTVYMEEFHQNGTPKLIASFEDGELEGKRQEFAYTGEPLIVEYWHNGVLDGVTTKFQNGCKYEEIPYKQGIKHGIAKRYVDGETVIEETHWAYNKRHGSSIIFVDGVAKTSWYFQGAKVSKSRYDDLNGRLEMVASNFEEN
ncbi:MAG: toxin-antitoxin system YwqK family antitoxin [Chlamydiia bacterium]